MYGNCTVCISNQTNNEIQNNNTVIQYICARIELRNWSGSKTAYMGITMYNDAMLCIMTVVFNRVTQTMEDSSTCHAPRHSYTLMEAPDGSSEFSQSMMESWWSQVTILGHCLNGSNKNRLLVNGAYWETERRTYCMERLDTIPQGGVKNKIQPCLLKRPLAEDCL